MTKWLSNKWNLIGIYVLCLFCMGYILYDRLTLGEIATTYTLLGIMCLVVYVMGVSRGLLLYAIQKDDIDEFLKIIRKDLDDDED